jgi:hypothetical protein
MTEAVENSTSPNKAVLVKGSKGLGMRELINYFLAFLDCRKKITVKQEVSHRSTSLWIPLDGVL